MINLFLPTLLLKRQAEILCDNIGMDVTLDIISSRSIQVAENTFNTVMYKFFDLLLLHFALSYSVKIITNKNASRTKKLYR